jgi:hypothetical protein
VKLVTTQKIAIPKLVMAIAPDITEVNDKTLITKAITIRNVLSEDPIFFFIDSV